MPDDAPHQPDRAEEAVRRTVAAYDAIAEDYRARWGETDPLVEAKEALARRLSSRARVLDVGCGPGRDLAWFAGRGFEAIGLDRSAAMLAAATRVAPTVRADARRIPLRDACLDAWWASASLLHLPTDEIWRALAELHRVSRPQAVGFVAVKEGEGAGLEPVGDGARARYVRYWAARDLDAALWTAGWQLDKAWHSADALGRHPWLSRFVMPRAAG